METKNWGVRGSWIAETVKSLPTLCYCSIAVGGPLFLIVLFPPSIPFLLLLFFSIPLRYLCNFFTDLPLTTTNNL